VKRAFVLLVLALSACATHEGAPGSGSLDTFDRAMRDWMAAHHVSRGSVAVMRDDHLVFAAGYGGRRADERVPVWSMSKAITGVCIATLVQDGALRFDDPIGPWLARIPRVAAPADPRLAQVTVGQLLTHRSGLPSVVGDNRFAPGMFQLLRQRRPTEATAAALMPSILRLHLAGVPGAEHHYSNTGYLLLGQIIEAATNQTYEAACGQRVLARAGISAPRLEAEWGRLLQASAGWALSGPEYLGFVRLLERRAHGLLSADTQRWARAPEGRWIDETHAFAYTLGIRLDVRTAGRLTIFHGGGWLWDQNDALGGAIHEKRGTWFVLTDDGVAWFASYDGVHIDTDPDAVNALHDALWHAHRRVFRWPSRDQFPAMGVQPLV
jgi:CubicO group peptidase (beta-lactamase class C family)